MKPCWLYIYENKDRNSIYIGIADSMSRVYEKHNKAADQLRNDPGTVILQTVTPFTSRPDARKAEAIAIHIAAFAGTSISAEDDDGQVFTLTNLSGSNSTKELGPAIYEQPGTVDWVTLRSTVIVAISAEELEGRPAPFGGHTGAFFAERARKYWSISPLKRPKIKRLIAVLKGSNNRILGDWDVAPNQPWLESSNAQHRVAIPLIAPAENNPRGILGMRLTGHRANMDATYSPDLKGRPTQLG